MAEEKITKEQCIALLQKKYLSLQEKGENRYPQRSDFEDSQVMSIKSFLGPWPRALEKTGIKPMREKNEK